MPKKTKSTKWLFTQLKPVYEDINFRPVTKQELIEWFEMSALDYMKEPGHTHFCTQCKRRFTCPTKDSLTCGRGHLTTCYPCRDKHEKEAN